MTIFTHPGLTFLPYTEADILKTRILVWAPLPTFRGPTSHSKMSGLEIFLHPTWEVKGSGDCECLHPILFPTWHLRSMTQTRIPLFKICYPALSEGAAGFTLRIDLCRRQTHRINSGLGCLIDQGDPPHWGLHHESKMV